MRQALIIVFASLLLVLPFYFAHQRPKPNPSANQQMSKQVLAIETTQKEGPGVLMRLKIPAINVDAAIESIGLTPAGAMDVPRNITDVGWYNLGARPGENGSAVIAGHFDGENNTPGVFFDLNKLKSGDKLYIKDNMGKSSTFIVRESRTYLPGYADEVFSSSDGAHLNLITCDGVWDGTKKSYSKRLVVFADMGVLKN